MMPARFDALTAIGRRRALTRGESGELELILRNAHRRRRKLPERREVLLRRVERYRDRVRAAQLAVERVEARIRAIEEELDPAARLGRLERELGL